MDEIQEARKKFQKELNGGTSSLVLLSVLGRAAKPMYGYQIARHIEAYTQDAAFMKQGALYPVLRSLESGGLLESRVEPSVSGPPRRYYNITEAGRTVLEKWTEVWQQTRAFVDSILEGDKEDE